jgi:hypothetical protein
LPAIKRIEVRFGKVIDGPRGRLVDAEEPFTAKRPLLFLTKTTLQMGYMICFSMWLEGIPISFVLLDATCIVHETNHLLAGHPTSLLLAILRYVYTPPVMNTIADIVIDLKQYIRSTWIDGKSELGLPSTSRDQLALEARSTIQEALQRPAVSFATAGMSYASLISPDWDWSIKPEDHVTKPDLATIVAEMNSTGGIASERNPNWPPLADPGIAVDMSYAQIKNSDENINIPEVPTWLAGLSGLLLFYRLRRRR